jgi:hypothetical protein
MTTQWPGRVIDGIDTNGHSANRGHTTLEAEMQFLVSWKARSGGSGESNEQAVKRGVQLFTKWSPPAGMEFKAFLQRADGEGGYAVVETDDALLLLEGPAKFGPYFEFTQVPVVDIMDGLPVTQDGIEYRDSIS